MKDSKTTGNFEVVIAETNQLIHSKSTRGQGKCETKAETNAVIDQVRTFLESRK